MKLLKILTSFMLVFGFLSVNVIANDSYDDVQYLLVSEEQLEINRTSAQEEAMSLYLRSKSSGQAMVMGIGDVYYTSRSTGRSEIKSPNIWNLVFGQLAGGVNLGSGGGSICVKDSSTSAGSISVGLGLAVGNPYISASFSLSLTPGTKSAAATYDCPLQPSSMLNKYVKLWANNQYKLEEYRIYIWDGIHTSTLSGTNDYFVTQYVYSRAFDYRLAQ